MNKIIVHKSFVDETGTIVADAQFEVLVDESDFPFLSSMPWAYCCGYVVTNIPVFERTTNGPRKISMHRLLLGSPVKQHVHHINGNRLDNRRSNLVTMSVSDHIRLHKSRANGAKGGRPKKIVEPAPSE